MNRSFRMAGALLLAIVAGLALTLSSVGGLGVADGAVFDRPIPAPTAPKGHDSPRPVIPNNRKKQIRKHHAMVPSSVESTVLPPCANPKGVGVVANSGEDTVSFLNLELNQECERLGVPSGAIGASVTPDGKTALVSSFGGQRVSLFDLTVDPPVLAGTIDTTTLTESVCITPDSRFAVTADGSLGTVDVRSIDIAHRTTVNSLAIDGATGCVISDQSVALGFFTVVIADFNSNLFRVLHLDATTGTLTDPGVIIENSEGNGLDAIAISASGRSLAVATNFFTDNVTILAIDSTGQVTVMGALPTGFEPGSLAIAPNGETAWVVNHGDGKVAKLAISPSDVVTDTGVRITIPVCAPNTFFGASGIAVNADSTEALVSNNCADTLQQLDIINNEFTGVEIAVRASPAQIGLPGRFVPPAADLSITMAASPDPVEVGQHLTYTVMVTNEGPNAAAGVVLTDALPADVTFVSAAPSQGTSSNTSSITCNLGTIIHNASATVTIVTTPIVAGAITNVVNVSSDVDDPDLSNNSATVSTTSWSILFRTAGASLGINLDTGEFTLTYLVDGEPHACSGRRARVSDGFLTISDRCTPDLRDQIRAVGGTDGSITVQLIDRTGSSARSRVIRRFSLTRVQAQASCVQPPAGLVSWWPGDGDANDIIDGNHGSLQKGTTFAPGMVGQAFSVDGVDDFIQITDSDNLDITSQITIEGWVMPRAPGNADGTTFILLKGENQGTTTQSYGLVWGNDRVFFRVGSDTAIDTVGSSVVSLNQFTHVAGTYNGATLRLYINGVLDNSKTTSIGALQNTVFPLLIGTSLRNGLTVEFFNGVVDELGIYNRALSAAEIQAIFNAGSEGKCKVIRVLGIDTGSSWGYSIVPFLSRVTFTKVSPADFATVDLNLYDVLFVSETFLGGGLFPPAQTTLDALTARESDLAAWISAGHGVVALSEPIGTGRFQWLPAAVRPSVGDQFCDDGVTIVRPDHPVMAGLSDGGLSGWGCASHGDFTSPGGLEMLVSDGDTRPITLAGTFGQGKIVITDQDPDFHHFFGTVKPDQVTFVQNAIHWAAIPAEGSVGTAGAVLPAVSGTR